MTTILKIRAELGRRLRAALSSEFAVAVSPDHPLLFRSVDLLIGGPSGLTAVMMRSAAEKRRPSAFTARLTLNRAALPNYTRFIYAIGDSKSDLDYERSQTGHFDFIIELNRRSTMKELVLVAEERQSRSPTRSKPNSEIITRFSDTYRLSRFLLQRGRRVSRTRYSSKDPQVDDWGIEFAVFDDAPTISAIAELALVRTERWFILQGTAAVPSNEFAGAAVVPSVPTYRNDPGKAVRAAAFAGWVFVPMQSTLLREEVSDLIMKYTGPI
ncbi:MAG: hypothetical protein KIT43_16175 [Bauldia sp.]|nr:hypothetical protein [Bauldia sp.]